MEMQNSKIKTQNCNSKSKSSAGGGFRTFFFCLFLDPRLRRAQPSRSGQRVPCAFARQREGMTLLLVILILAALLSISIGIFNVVFGEIQLSGELNNAFVAFYAADEGVERLLYDYFVANALGCPPLPTSCSYGPTTITLSNGACHTLRLTRTGNSLTALATGEYRCGSPTLSVKRALQYSTQL